MQGTAAPCPILGQKSHRHKWLPGIYSWNLKPKNVLIFYALDIGSSAGIDFQ
jgi:hypothetical protein